MSSLACVYPHIGYADAVHTALAGHDIPPAVTDVRLTDDAEPHLVIACRWEPTPDRPEGLRVVWSHIVGWRYEDPATGDSGLVPAASVADPDALADTVLLLLAAQDLGELRLTGPEWEHATTLDRCLAAYESGVDA